MTVTCFDPVEDAGARLLILGSMPGELSLAAGQYYAAPRNRFWSVAGALFSFDPELPYESRLSALKGAGVALWDVLQSCERKGSLDASIVESTEVPNDFTGFLEAHRDVRAIAFNGQKAAKSFDRRLALPTTVHDRVAFLTLPSTSAANARTGYDGLVEQWRKVLPFLELIR